MKNDIFALNNYLFEAIERINDDELDNDGLNKEISRAKATVDIAKTIIDGGNLLLGMKKQLDEYGSGENIKMPLLGKYNEKDHKD